MNMAPNPEEIIDGKIRKYLLRAEKILIEKFQSTSEDKVIEVAKMLQMEELIETLKS